MHKITNMCKEFLSSHEHRQVMQQEPCIVHSKHSLPVYQRGKSRSNKFLPPLVNQPLIRFCLNIRKVSLLEHPLPFSFMNFPWSMHAGKHILYQFAFTKLLTSTHILIRQSLLRIEERFAKNRGNGDQSFQTFKNPRGFSS
jgi:hypothetical protein